MTRVLIAGGGTGGHLFPGLAVAHAIMAQRPDAAIAFAGTDHGIEAQVIPNTPFTLFTLPVQGLIQVGWWRRIGALLALPGALSAAWRVLRQFAPDLVVGVGGYASAPLLFMAGLTRTPRVILEQNAIPGVTNRVFGPHVDRVFLAFADARARFSHGADTKRDNFSVPGNPVRADVLQAVSDTGDTEGIDDASGTGPITGADTGPHVLIFGGSQGATALNDALLEAAPALFERFPDLTLHHQTGTNDLYRVRKAALEFGSGYRVTAFVDDMGAAYRPANLVVCRAGATSVAELTALGKPSLLVPYPYATHDHQRANAEALEAAGGTEIVPQTELTGEHLAQRIIGLLEHPARLATMADAARSQGHPDAAERIAEACLVLVDTDARKGTDSPMETATR